MTVLETTVEDLTKGYLTARGSQSELSFGRLTPQIEREANSREHAQVHVPLTVPSTFRSSMEKS